MAARRRGHGEGSIYQRESDGKWCTSVDLGIVNGKRKRKVIYGKTRKEVADKLKAVHRDIQQGLQWEDIDYARHTVSVRASLQRIRGQLVRAETKTKASVRTLRVPDALLATLQAHHERQQTEGYSGSYVFTSTAGTPLEHR